jgi:hypothetical protein
MNQSFVRVLGLLLAVAGVGLWGAGCSSAPKAKPYNVSITKTTPASIEVDLIGVTPLEKGPLEGYSIDQYWASGDRLRGGLVEGRDRLTVRLKMGEPWVLDRKDPIWATWKERGVKELLLIANLPGTFAAGPADPRRVFIPLNDWKEKTIQIEVREAQIIFLTPRK